MEFNKQLSVSRNMVWNTVGSFTYLVCQWVLTLIVVRVSSDMENVGNFSLAISITNIFFNLACFNVRPYLVSDISGKYKEHEYSAFRVSTGLAALLLCLGYINIFNYTIDQKVCIAGYMIFKLGEAWVDLLHGLEQRKNRMDIGGISLLVRGILSLIGFTICLILTESIFLSIIAMTIFTWGFIYFFDMRIIKAFAVISPRITVSRTVKIFKEFMPLTAGALMSTFATTYPRQFLESYSGTDILGIYATVATPAVIVQVAASYVFNPFLTLFSRYYSEGKKREFFQLFFKTCAILFGISVLALVGGKIFGRWGLNLLYGKEISAYAYLLIPVILFTSLNAFVWFLWNILIVVRKLKSLLFVNFVSLLFLLCIVQKMVVVYGMNGVSYCLILFSMLLIVQMLILLLKCFNTE